MNSRRNFLKKIGLAAGAVAGAGGVGLNTLVYSDESPIHKDDKRNTEAEVFPNLCEQGVSPSRVLADAIVQTPPTKPESVLANIPEGGKFPIQAWADEAVRLLEENMKIGSLVTRDFSPDTAQYGDVVNARRPQAFKLVRKSDDYDPRIHISDTVTNNIRTPLSNDIFCKFLIHDSDYQHRWEILADLYLAPAITAVARQIDMQVYETIASRALPYVSNRDAWELALDARQYLNETKTYCNNRNWIVSPSLEAHLRRSGKMVGDKILGVDVLPDSALPDGEGLAFHRDAFLLVNRPQPLPMYFGGVESAKGIRNDLSVRVVAQYDIASQGTIITLSCLTGVAACDTDFCVNMKQLPPMGASTFRKGNFNVNVKPGHDPREIARAIRREIRRPHLTQKQVSDHVNHEIMSKRTASHFSK